MNEEIEKVEQLDELDSKRQIIAVYDNNEGAYGVRINAGSVEETAFAIAVIIKCLNRDEVVSKEQMLELINKYVNDVQYEEVQS